MNAVLDALLKRYAPGATLSEYLIHPKYRYNDMVRFYVRLRNEFGNKFGLQPVVVTMFASTRSLDYFINDRMDWVKVTKITDKHYVMSGMIDFQYTYPSRNRCNMIFMDEIPRKIAFMELRNKKLVVASKISILATNPWPVRGDFAVLGS